MKSGLKSASRVPRSAPPSKPSTLQHHGERAAAMWDSIRRQTGAVQPPGAAPIPPGAGADVPSDSEITRSTVPAGTADGCGSGFGWW